MISYKSFIAQAVFILFVITAFLSVIYIPVSHEEIIAFSDLLYHDFAFYTLDIKLTENGLMIFQGVVGSLVSFSGGVLLISAFRNGWIFREIRQTFSEGYYSFRNFWYPLQRLYVQEKWIAVFVFLIILTVRLYFAFNTPLHTDEIATYDYFVNRGLVAVTGYYPIPNNHIFFSVIGWTFNQFTDNLYIVLRLPVFLISFFGSLLFFRFLYQRTGFFISLLSVSFFMMSDPGIYYSFIGRGYFLVLLFSIISFFSFLRIIKSSDKRNFYWFTFSVSSILGFYSIPIFLYSYLTICFLAVIFILYRKDWVRFKELVVSGFITGISTIALYLPIVFISGSGALFGNQYVKPKSFLSILGGIWGHVHTVEQALIGYSFGVQLFLAILILYLFLYYKKKFSFRYKYIGLAALCMASLPYIIFLIQKVFPPERVLLYKFFYLCIAFAILVDLFLKAVSFPAKFRNLLIPAFIVIYGFNHIYHKANELPESWNFTRHLQASYESSIQYEPDNIYFQSIFHEFYFLHFSSNENKKMSFTSRQVKEGEVYDMVIIQSDMEFPEVFCEEDYQMVYTDKYVKVFKMSDDMPEEAN